MTIDDTNRLMITDPRAVRALINPERLLATDELYRTQKPLTATYLARLAGVSPSAMSYHLRELAVHGIIRRSDAETDARERPWEAVSQNYSIVASDESSAGIRAALLDLRMDPMRQRMLAVLSNRTNTPLEQREEPFMVLATGDLYLTPQEYADAQTRIDGIWRHYEQLGAGRSESIHFRHAQYMWSCMPAIPRIGD